MRPTFEQLENEAESLEPTNKLFQRAIFMLLCTQLYTKEELKENAARLLLYAPKGASIMDVFELHNGEKGTMLISPFVHMNLYPEFVESYGTHSIKKLNWLKEVISK